MSGDASGTPRQLRVRALGVAQCLLGGVLLVRPDPLARAVAGRPDGVPPRWVLRLLGGRLVVQGAGSLALPSPAVATAGAGVDLLHAASMVALAVGSRRYRRLALVNVVAATTSAAVGAPTARAARLVRGAHGGTGPGLTSTS